MGNQILAIQGKKRGNFGQRRKLITLFWLNLRSRHGVTSGAMLRVYCHRDNKDDELMKLASRLTVTALLKWTILVKKTHYHP